MAMEIVSIAGSLLTVKVSGKLKKSELDELQKAAIKVINSGAKARCLVLAEAFDGWDKAKGWGDISFQMDYDQMIEKIAIVGAPKWEDEISAFVASGLRPVGIKYFLPGQLAQARVWVAK